jgi:hypothetical protein
MMRDYALFVGRHVVRKSPLGYSPGSDECVRLLACCLDLL